MEAIMIFMIVFIASLIGALPFGLVNLTVLDVSNKHGLKSAMSISFGASIIEVVYVVVSFFAGKFLLQLIDSNTLLHFVFVIIPTAIGVVFWFRNKRNQVEKNVKSIALIKGITLNLLSVQVLFYWIIAMTVIASNWINLMQLHNLPTIILSVFLGKMLVLYLYALLSVSIYERFTFLSGNINKFIGTILIITGLLQYFK